ncbi:MAG: triose-phosphate isomerase [bacterium]
MRRPIIAGNWKMNKTIFEAEVLVKGLIPLVRESKTVDVVVVPPYIALKTISNLIKDTNVELGAQNIFWEEKGAYTGEISPVMVKDAGCQYAIIGHSERRQYFGETDQTVNKKIKAALSNDLTPIACVGESLEQREEGETFKVIDIQVRNGLASLTNDQMEKIVIAYEPIWAIGTGKNATPGQANEVHFYIRGLLKKFFSDDVALKVRIQYGGSVKPDTIDELMAQPDIDGALVGGASLQADSFARIVNFQQR